MLTFFENITHITLGIIACIFWLVVIIGGTIELYDRIRGKNSEPTNNRPDGGLYDA